MAINTIDTNGYWMVGNTHIYVPSYETKITTSNVVGSSSGRDESGIMHIDWLRRKVYKIFLVYRGMTASELAFMQNLIVGKEFTFTFLYAGTVHTINAYCGESEVTMYSYSSGGDIYTDVSMNVIEM
jgi:hypothetical protein